MLAVVRYSAPETPWLLAEEEARCAAMTAAEAGDAGSQEGRLVDDCKYRCLVCRKLFRGPEFVHKHLRERHWDDFHCGRPAPSTAPETAAAKGDQFFDADAVQDAAEKGDLSCLQQVLQRLGAPLKLPSMQNSALLKQSDVDGSTPLHLCAKQGHADCVQLLTSVDATLLDDGGNSPLHLAAQDGQQQVVDLLLSSGLGSDVVSGASQRTPLHLAAANGHAEVCGQLLLHRATLGGPGGGPWVKVMGWVEERESTGR
eukprot:Skav232195  [mRNA]  locus=scaffold3716:8493:17830:+ [translate_table: standard]